jgi:class 3 adenylate cyclase
VLFADLVGYTGRSERLDVEDVEQLLAPYQALLLESVERTGGVIAKFLGDGVMALFGALVAHEDDPERAVRCGISVREELAAKEGNGQLGPHVRIGVATGEALVVATESGQTDAIGDVVNTASRLESSALEDARLGRPATLGSARAVSVCTSSESGQGSLR